MADGVSSFAALDAFVDAGFNLIDTANIYSRWVPGHEGGECERVIGRWLKKGGKRDRVRIPPSSATPAAVALAWQIARTGITAPIASATSVAQWEQLAQAARLVLTPAQIGQIDQASAGG